jgi:VanZ family protein
LALASLGVLQPAYAQSADSWTGQDKVKHLGMSAPFGMIGSAMVPAGAPPAQRILHGTLIGALPGLARELADFGRPGATPSMKDMAANLVGAALGATVGDCCLVRPLVRSDRVDGIGVEYRIEF